MVIAMNINEVYLRIIETENDSDVVKLAKKEVMVIPILINAMLDKIIVVRKIYLSTLANKHLSWCIRIFNT